MKSQFGPYTCAGVIGRGGMGTVYKGHETSLNRFVAIKVLADSLSHDETIKSRFLREARSMAAISDAHILQIHFIGEDQGQTYFVMEFVDGESLGALLKRRGKLTQTQAVHVIHQAAQGLAMAHDRGVVHRDIKPGNILISRRGEVKIADFGIALTNEDIHKKLTLTGEFVGTPGYLSPEVCLARRVDLRSDIFSLGIVLFECLTGRMPFTDESPLGLLLEVVKADIPDVRALNSDVDAGLSSILARMVAKEPSERYQSCHELLADLNRCAAIRQADALAGVAQSTPVARPAGATIASGPPPGNMRQDIRTRITPRRVIGSAPVIARPPTHAAQTRVRPRYLPAAAALALVLAVSAWAFRDDLRWLSVPPWRGDETARANPSTGSAGDQDRRERSAAADPSTPTHGAIVAPIVSTGDANPSRGAVTSREAEANTHLPSLESDDEIFDSGLARLDADYRYATADDRVTTGTGYIAANGAPAMLADLPAPALAARALPASVNVFWPGIFQPDIFRAPARDFRFGVADNWMPHASYVIRPVNASDPPHDAFNALRTYKEHADTPRRFAELQPSPARWLTSSGDNSALRATIASEVSSKAQAGHGMAKVRMAYDPQPQAAQQRAPSGQYRMGGKASAPMSAVKLSQEGGAGISRFRRVPASASLMRAHQPLVRNEKPALNRPPPAPHN